MIGAVAKGLHMGMHTGHVMALACFMHTSPWFALYMAVQASIAAPHIFCSHAKRAHASA